MAEHLFKSILKKYPKGDDSYTFVLSHFADLQVIQGAYTEAEANYLKTQAIIEEKYGKNSVDYIMISQGIAELYRKTGRFPQAEGRLLESLDIYDGIGVANDSLYSYLIGTLAATYSGLGSYSEAEKYLLELVEMDKQQYGDSSGFYASSISNLAAVYFHQGRYQEAHDLFEASLQLTESALGSSSLDYVLTLSWLATVKRQMGALEEAAQLYDTNLDLQRKYFGQHQPEYANTLENKAKLLMIMNKHEEARAALSQVLRNRQKLLGKAHPRYGQTINKLAILNWATGNADVAYKYYKQTFENYYQQIDAVFPTMNEIQKAVFYNTKLKKTFEEFNSFAAEHFKESPQVVSDMYNYQLATKGLIMYATNKVRNNILNSKDSSLIAKYEAWVSSKELLAKMFSLTKEQLAARNINLDSIAAANDRLEKDLSAASSVFANTYVNESYTWKDVQKKLGPKDAAIEIIRFRKFVPDSSGYFSDEIYYAALIVTAKTKRHPSFVLIGNGKTLESRYLANYRNSIKFKIEEKYSYNFFWKPIAEQLDGIDRVYFSPDGVYNQVSLYTMLNPDTERYLIDEVTVQMLSNTKDLVLFDGEPASQAEAGSKALLLGFPNYNYGVGDTDAEARAEVVANTVVADRNRKRQRSGNSSIRGEEASGLSRGATRGSLSRGLRGGLQRLLRGNQQLTMLPGTKKEVENISALYADSNIAFDTLLLDNAQEGSIKQMNHPTTLHLATHGFFIEDTDLATTDENMEYMENPLLRSGLIFAGANKLLKPISDDEDLAGDDGVLTAYEAMNLNLDHTDLVVLSACETGLGKVQNGEGVYGLQRAFQIAGAKSIIMSLWSVDDEATNELMSSFYKKWLETGNRQAAFRQAQQQLKEKYKQPYYWGAFVMLGK